MEMMEKKGRLGSESDGWIALYHVLYVSQWRKSSLACLRSWWTNEWLLGIVHTLNLPVRYSLSLALLLIVGWCLFGYGEWGRLVMKGWEIEAGLHPWSDCWFSRFDQAEKVLCLKKQISSSSTQVRGWFEDQMTTDRLIRYLVYHQIYSKSPDVANHRWNRS